MAVRALVLVVLLLPLAPAAPAGDAPPPMLLPLPPAGPASFSFASDVYSADVSWPSAAQSVAAGSRVFTASLDVSGRVGTLAQDLRVGDVFVLRWTDAVADRFFVLPEASTDALGNPVLTLRVTRAPLDAADLAGLSGMARLTFLRDAILHDYEFHLPSTAAAPSVYSTTTATWSRPVLAHGSVLPDGSVVTDDGASLAPYGKWQAGATHGVFQRDAASLVGHGRLQQARMVNYLGDGSLRVTPTSTQVRTVFTGFLDTSIAGFDSGLWTKDALVFSSSDPAPAGFAARLSTLAAGEGRPPPLRLFDPASVDVPTPTGPIPHVLVGVPDSGINPYHEIYYRPNLTVHPCTYILGFPCSIPALPLSVGQYGSWDEAWAADKALWDSLEYRKWYWIPKTVFVAVMCEGSTNLGSATEGTNRCLIDDSSMHGTGTTSSILTENPNALIAFKEGNSATDVFEDGTLPIDVLSYSWGAAVPLALPGVITTPRDYRPFYVAASGNEGAFPVVLDSDKASQAVINVGAADAATRSEPGYSGWKTADYVSQYCRPTAETRSIREYRASYCGTSFAAPTVAGALSKVILELRRESGYTGTIVNGMVDPILGVSKWDVRDALNRTATYAPEARFPSQGGTVPVAPAAPWYQWGWGYVDATVVDATLACIRDETACPDKDAATHAYMDALWTFRDAYAGWTAFDAYGCARNQRAACDRLPGRS